MNTKRASFHRNQQGVVLVTALIMLLLMTLIGVTAMRSSTLEERMAGNLKELQRSFHAAEAGLRLGEEYAAENTPASAFGACVDDSDFVPLYGVDDALNRDEAIPDRCYAIGDPVIRDFVSASGHTAHGLTDGGNFAMAIPTYRYTVDAAGRVGSETATTALRSTYVVGDF